MPAPKPKLILGNANITVMVGKDRSGHFFKVVDEQTKAPHYLPVPDMDKLMSTCTQLCFLFIKNEGVNIEDTLTTIALCTKTH